jgi:hypothetical protein
VTEQEQRRLPVTVISGFLGEQRLITAVRSKWNQQPLFVQHHCARAVRGILQGRFAASCCQVAKHQVPI